MFYTLLKFLGWGALLAVVGGCIGWALRSLRCRGEIAKAKSTSVDDDEIERMRHRLANLEHVVAERDRLRIQLADVRHADSPGIVGAEVPAPSSSDHLPETAPASVAPSDAAPDDEEASIEPRDGADDADGSTDVAALVGADEQDAQPEDDDPPAESVSEPLDLDAAADELGRTVTLDDLTVVEGIGPKISELCSGIGVTTWQQLADADVGDLQSMLDAAGSRYTVHKPDTWPRQAALLATGRWAEFRALTGELDGGR